MAKETENFEDLIKQAVGIEILKEVSSEPIKDNTQTQDTLEEDSLLLQKNTLEINSNTIALEKQNKAIADNKAEFEALVKELNNAGGDVSKIEILSNAIEKNTNQALSLLEERVNHVKEFLNEGYIQVYRTSDYQSDVEKGGGIYGLPYLEKGGSRKEDLYAGSFWTPAKHAAFEYGKHAYSGFYKNDNELRVTDAHKDSWTDLHNYKTSSSDPYADKFYAALNDKLKLEDTIKNIVKDDYRSDAIFDDVYYDSLSGFTDSAIKRVIKRESSKFGENAEFIDSINKYGEVMKVLAEASESMDTPLSIGSKSTDDISHIAQYKMGYDSVYFEQLRDFGGIEDQLSTKNDKVETYIKEIQQLENHKYPIDKMLNTEGVYNTVVERFKDINPNFKDIYSAYDSNISVKDFFENRNDIGETIIKEYERNNGSVYNKGNFINEDDLRTYVQKFIKNEMADFFTNKIKDNSFNYLLDDGTDDDWVDMGTSVLDDDDNDIYDIDMYDPEEDEIGDNDISTKTDKITETLEEYKNNINGVKHYIVDNLDFLMKDLGIQNAKLESLWSDDPIADFGGELHYIDTHQKFVKGKQSVFDYLNNNYVIGSNDYETVLNPKNSNIEYGDYESVSPVSDFVSLESDQFCQLIDELITNTVEYYAETAYNAAGVDKDWVHEEFGQIIKNYLKGLSEASAGVNWGDNLSLTANGKSFNIPINPTKVNDLVITKDGRAFVTDDADNIIATKNLGSLGSGTQNVKREIGGETVGVLSNEDVKSFIQNVKQIRSSGDLDFQKILEILGPKATLGDLNKVENDISNKNIESIVEIAIEKASQNLAERNIVKHNFNSLAADNYKLDDSIIRNYRTQTSDYEKLIKFTDNLEKLANSGSLMTFSETSLINKANSYKDIIGSYQKNSVYDKESEEYEEVITGSGLLFKLGNLREEMLLLGDEINNSVLSEDEEIAKKEQLLQKEEEFKTKMEELASVLNKANSELGESVKQEETLQANANKPKKNSVYDNYKYALVRNKSQQDEYEAELPYQFSATGNLKDAFKRTMFNKATGFKQRQGAVGFAANLGYAVSGTALSVALGGFVTGLKKGTQELIKFSRASIEAFGKMESVKTNLGIVYGSQSQANQTFDEIAQYAIKSPFGVETVSQFAVQLKQSGVYASDLMNTLKQIGDVAGGNQQKFGNIANAFAQIEANGKATTRQLREFATAGIPIYKQLSEQLGVGVAQVRKMTEEGKITSTVIENAFSQLTGEGGTFHNAVNIGAKTWNARKQNLSDIAELAKASFGEFLVNIGGTGQEDSFAKTLLSFKESFWQGLNDWVSVKNIEKSVSNIEKQDNRLQSLTKLYAQLKKENADKKLLKTIQEEIEKQEGYKTPEERRANNETMYNVLKSQYGINDNKTMANTNEYRAAESLQHILQEYIVKDGYISRVQIPVDKLGIGLPEDIKEVWETYLTDSNRLHVANNYDPRTPNHEVLSLEERNELIKKIQEDILTVTLTLKSYLDNNYSEENYLKFIEETKDYTDSVAINEANKLITSAAEWADKIAKKDENSLFNFSQKSAEYWKKTPEGQQELQELEEAEWNKLYEKYFQVSKLFDESGKLVNKTALKIDEIVDAYKAGIFEIGDSVLERPELYAYDYAANIIKTEAQLADMEKTYKSAEERAYGYLESIIATNEVVPEVAEAFRNLKNTLIEIPAGMPSYVAANYQNQFARNNTFNMARTSAALRNAGNVAERYGQSDLFETVALQFSELAKTSTPKNYAETHPDKSKSKDKDTYPLWQRIINSTLGVDLSLFKNKGIKTGGEAFNIFNDKSNRETIQATFREMLNSRSLTDIVSKGFIQYTDKYTPAENSSTNGRKKIDYEATAKEFKSFATSLRSTSAETRAYANSLQQQNDAINDFYAQAITMTEEAENVYDPEYQKYLQDLFKNIEALDTNAFDLGFSRLEDGTLVFEELSVDAAAEWQKGKSEYIQSLNVLADFKDSLKDAKEEVDKLSMSLGISSGIYGTGMFADVDLELIQQMSDLIEGVLRKDEYKQFVEQTGISTKEIMNLMASNQTNTLEEFLAKTSEKLGVPLDKVERVMTARPIISDDYLKEETEAEKEYNSVKDAYAELIKIKNQAYGRQTKVMNEINGRLPSRESAVGKSLTVQDMYSIYKGSREKYNFLSSGEIEDIIKIEQVVEDAENSIKGWSDTINSLKSAAEASRRELEADYKAKQEQADADFAANGTYVEDDLTKSLRDIIKTLYDIWTQTKALPEIQKGIDYNNARRDLDNNLNKPHSFFIQSDLFGTDKTGYNSVKEQYISNEMGLTDVNTNMKEYFRNSVTKGNGIIDADLLLQKYGGSIDYEDKAFIKQFTPEMLEAIKWLEENSSMVDFDIFKRPKVDADKMRAAGYEDFPEDGYATTYSNSLYDKQSKKYVNVTPIQENGEVLSYEDMEQYVEQFMRTRLDPLHIIEGIFDSQESAVSWAEEFHKQQSVLYGENGEGNISVDDIQSYSDRIDGILEALYNAEISEDLKLIFNGQAKSKLDELQQTINESVKNSLFDGVSKSFELMGQNVKDMATASEEIGKAWKEIGQNILSSIGAQITSTGLTIAAQQAMLGNWAGVAAGLLMAGVGAASSFASGILNDDSDDKAAQKEARLKSLKDMLADLIDQAKTDAEYYEKNLRHESAIDTSYNISTQKVNDAIITPNGNVITTHPDDYLIATKTPDSLVSNTRQGTTVVNFTLVDKSTGGKVEAQQVKQTTNEDGSVEIEAVVTAIMNKNIADGTSDDAFAIMQQRLNGQSYAM